MLNQCFTIALLTNALLTIALLTIALLMLRSRADELG